ncbi:hypothetical protein ACWGDS_44360 [Streptomyces sp. NPDC055059]|uniref:hypothetical protein n=1 Tax=Streptomyces sp. NPDC127172 TaxID=3345382 RepID=UPI0036399FAD
MRELGTLLTAPDTDKAALEAALRGCGIPDGGPYRVVVAEVGSGREDWAQGALTEAAAHVPHTAPPWAGSPTAPRSPSSQGRTP